MRYKNQRFYLLILFSFIEVYDKTLFGLINSGIGLADLVVVVIICITCRN